MTIKDKNMKFIIQRNRECFYAEKLSEEYIIYNPYTKNAECLKPDPFFDIYGNDLRLSILNFLKKAEENLCLFSLTDEEYRFLLSLITKVRKEIFLRHRKNILNLVRADKKALVRNPDLRNTFPELFLFLYNYNLLITKKAEMDLTLEMFDHQEEEQPTNYVSSLKEDSEKELDILMVRARERFDEQKMS